VPSYGQYSVFSVSGHRGEGAYSGHIKVAQITTETFEKILDATDIVDLINSYIPLKRAGSAYKANCPFHHEKTPSFNVSPTRQTFHCFGCGKHGSAIGFVMEYEGLPFVEAVKKLAAKANVPI